MCLFHTVAGIKAGKEINFLSEKVSPVNLSIIFFHSLVALYAHLMEAECSGLEKPHPSALCCSS